MLGSIWKDWSDGMRYSDLCIDLESLSDGKSSQKGFFYNGIWNSVVYRGNEVLRERSELLVIKGNSIFMDIRDDGIRLPGGSTEKDISIIETAIKECQEEAKITPSNVKYYGYYIELFRNGKRTPKWILESHFPVTYTGYLTHVCVGTYEENFTGYIRPEDRDNLNVDAKLVPINKAKKYLNNVQKKALDKYLKEEKYPNFSIGIESNFCIVLESSRAYSNHSYDHLIEDCRAVISKLSEREKFWIGNGYWVDSDHVVYREVQYSNGKPVAFIDVYKLPRTGNCGHIVIAVAPEARGRGIAGKLVENAKRICQGKDEIDSLGWLVDSDNEVSQTMAKKFGFKFVGYRNHKKELEFVYKF